MLRSMFSGISGLRGHQSMLDVIGNNIANVNTSGYKSSQAVFQDTLSQVISGGGVPTPLVGGTNPMSIGLGVQMGGVTTSFTQGASQTTGRATDLAIQGDGFFMVRDQGQTLYTRQGSFDIDAMGRLVTPDGAIAQGWLADQNGVVNTNGGVTDLVMPLQQTINPQITTELTITGNIPANAPVNVAVAPAPPTPGSQVVLSIPTYDAQGAERTVEITLLHTAADTWTATATMANTGGGAAVAVGNTTLTWDPDTGAFTAPPALTITPTAATGDWSGGTIAVNFGTPGQPDGITQFAGASSIAATTQNGSPIGTLTSFGIGQDGTVTGVFSNGRSKPIGQLALANFANPSGLAKAGGSKFRDTPNSGLAQVGSAGDGGRGGLAASTLEMSNVDLAAEFVGMISAQRGFEASGRVISTADRVLDTVVNLGR